jgi:glycosyltransferase involved in cell wall biosynthesis
MRSTWPEAPPPVVPPAVLPRQPPVARIKVLHIVTRFIDGAGGNTLLSVLGADPARYDVWVAGSAGGPLWKRADDHGATTVPLHRFREVLSPRDDVLVLVQLVRLIRRERFSIVHTHSSKAGFLGRLAAWICRTPVVVHTIHGFSYHDFMSRRRRAAYLALERLARPLTDEFIAVAPQVAREAVEMRLAPPGAITVVPSAVELADVPHRPDPLVRAELGIPDDACVVGTVGRLNYQKAPLDFVRMAAFVAGAHPATRFVWVGKGALLDEARAEARRLGVHVMFTGFRSDATRIASCFDVYVVSSLYEGLGRGMTEAMAMARPVAATAVNGVVDLIQPGSTGLLAPPGQPDALARNVVWLLEHEEAARAMGEGGRSRVRRLFEPKLMCQLIEATYSRLLGLPSTEPSSSVPTDLRPDRAPSLSVG